MARSGILDRSEIVDKGLALGDNPGLVTLARTFLNLFLDEIYARFDWDFLLVEEQISITSGNDTISTLQADRSGLAAATAARGEETYRALQQIYIQDQGFAHEWDGPWHDLRARVRRAKNNNETGTPLWYQPNPNGEEIQLYPPPNQSYTAFMWYYKMPGEIMETDAGDSVVPELPSSNVMVNAVANFAAKYNRDPFHAILEREVDRALQRLRNSLPDSNRDRQDQLELDPHIYRWRRRGRGRR